jgi:hypothetical protein
MTLCILLLTARLGDVDVVVESLRQAGLRLHWVHVTTAGDYRTWLQADLDVVFIEGTAGPLPVGEAVHWLRTQQKDVLCIVLNGDSADAAMRQEAHTYTLSAAQLHTVGSVVQRALHATRAAAAVGAAPCGPAPAARGKARASGHGRT